MAYGASLLWLFEQVRSLLIGPPLERDIMKNCGLGQRLPSQKLRRFEK